MALVRDKAYPRDRRYYVDKRTCIKKAWISDSRQCYINKILAFRINEGYHMQKIPTYPYSYTEYVPRFNELFEGDRYDREISHEEFKKLAKDNFEIVFRTNIGGADFDPFFLYRLLMILGHAETPVLAKIPTGDEHILRLHSIVGDAALAKIWPCT